MDFEGPPAGDDPQSWYARGNALADYGGQDRTREAEALLRAAIDADYGPALVRLAELLVYQNPFRDAAADREAEAEALVRRAVDDGVPGAVMALAGVLATVGRFDDAEAGYRRAMAEGEVDAPTCLANLLHEGGRDAEAFAILRADAERGNDLAHQILGVSMDTGSQLWHDITARYEAARPPGAKFTFYCLRPRDWVMDVEGVPMRRPLRGGRGSLAGQVDVEGDWDSASVNGAIADDFGA